MLEIIGNGLIANAIKKNIKSENFGFFCSGVSNSKEKNIEEFEREKETFYNFSNLFDKSKTLVYFSTFSIFDKTPINLEYKKHKKEMENIVSELENHLIIRLPNVIGIGGNPNTMFNFFKNSIINQNELVIQIDSYRNLLDLDDVVCFLKSMKNDTSKIVNLIHPVSFKVIDIVNTMSEIMNKKVSIKKIDGGTNYYSQPDDYVTNILEDCGVDISDNYLKKIIKKYV